MGASFKSSKAPIKFPKVNQVATLKEFSIYDCAPRGRDVLNEGAMKQKGGKTSIKQTGGWVHSKKTGQLRHDRVQVCKETSPDVMTCNVKGINPKTGKKVNVPIVLGNRETYPAELKAQIEKDEAAYNLAKKDKAPKIYKKRKATKKPRKALGKR